MFFYELDNISSVRGGVWRLPNGNTIITSSGHLFEINTINEVEWIYQGNLSPTRVIKYAFDYFDSEFEEECNLGDINEDSSINILDLVSITNLILNNVYDECSDINSDSKLNILDLVTLVNIILEP